MLIIFILLLRQRFFVLIHALLDYSLERESLHDCLPLRVVVSAPRERPVPSYLIDHDLSERNLAQFCQDILVSVISELIFGESIKLRIHDHIACLKLNDFDVDAVELRHEPKVVEILRLSVVRACGER